MESVQYLPIYRKEMKSMQYIYGIETDHRIICLKIFAERIL